jgi:hypothetical protein
MTGERATMQLIRRAIQQARLKQPMRDLNKALGITWVGTSSPSSASAQVAPRPALPLSPPTFIV